MAKGKETSTVLASLMEKIAANETIFIGAASGYLFIGNVERFKADFPAIEEEADVALRKSTNDINRLIYEVNKAIEEENEDLDGTKLHKIQTKLLLTKKKLSERRVIECYDKILEDNEAGKAVIIKGTEMGRYWFKHEYDEKRVDYRDEVLEESEG